MELISYSIILGVFISAVIFFNGKKKTVFSGKIIDKHEGLYGIYYFIIAIDKKTVWTVKCTSEDWINYKTGAKYEFKIWQVI